MNERTRNALDRFLTTDPYEYGPHDAAELPAEPDAQDDAAQAMPDTAAQAAREAEKIEKYRAGRYRIPAPPVLHVEWNEADWIRFIDACGKWT